MVNPLARAGVAVGADGLIIEVHPCPEEALCDGAQALTLKQYAELVEQVRKIHELINADTISRVSQAADRIMTKYGEALERLVEG